jgi:hypothetical protein
MEIAISGVEDIGLQTVTGANLGDARQHVRQLVGMVPSCSSIGNPADRPEAAFGAQCALIGSN